MLHLRQRDSRNQHRKVKKSRNIFLAAVPLLLLHASAVLANAPQAGEEVVAYESKKFALGVGVGIVKFDTNAKVTSNITGKSRYIDLEGNLGLPDTDNVNTIYGAFRFNQKHSLHFGYFSIQRDSDVLSFSESFNDIILVETNVHIEDNSRFYNLAYGYNLFEDDRSDVTLIAGLKSIDLRLKAEATGEITFNGETRSAVEVVKADVLAPLPLIGVNLGFNFTPQWAVSARVGLVTGSYQEVSALLLETSINSRYQFSEHMGLLLGLTYFDADVDIDDDEELTEVSYAYTGVFLGLHIKY